MDKNSRWRCFTIFYSQIILAIEEEREEMMIPKNVEKYFIFQYLYGTKMWRRLAEIFGNFDYMKTFENIRDSWRQSINRKTSVFLPGITIKDLRCYIFSDHVHCSSVFLPRSCSLQMNWVNNFWPPIGEIKIHWGFLEELLKILKMLTLQIQISFSGEINFRNISGWDIRVVSFCVFGDFLP